MPKKIVVPVDLGHAERLPAMMEAAKALADKDARIILMNVVQDIPVYVAAELPAGINEQAANEAMADLEELGAKHGVKKADIEVRIGQAANSILEAAKEKHADLIVIASHHPQFGDFLLGSTAARVVRHAPCSVYVVR